MTESRTPSVMVQLNCPACGHLLRIDGRFAGTQGRCKHCGGTVTVPLVTSGYSGQDSNQSNQAVSPEQEIKYSGFWKRVMAWILDAALLAPISVLLTGFLIGPAMKPIEDLISEQILAEYQYLLLESIQSGIGTICLFLISWPYFSLMESSRLQGTLGKVAMGIRVSDLSGKRISAARAAWRYFAKIFSGATVIGYLLVAVTKRKQSLHDLFSGTLVLSGIPEAGNQKGLRIASATACIVIALLTLGVSSFFTDGEKIQRIKSIKLGELAYHGSAPGESASDQLDLSPSHRANIEAVRQTMLTTLEDALEGIARGPVEWKLEPLPEGDAYRSTHDALRVSFKNTESRPVTLVFLCEKDGDKLLIQKATIGYDTGSPELFFELLFMGILNKFELEAGTVISETVTETSYGLQENTVYLTTGRIFAAVTPEKFEELMSAGSSESSEYSHAWESATQSGDAIRIEPGNELRIVNLLPDTVRTDLCKVELRVTTSDPSSLGEAVNTELAGFYTSKHWMSQFTKQAE